MFEEGDWYEPFIEKTINFIRTLLALQRKEIIEEIEKMIFSCYPSDMENFNTMTDDQAHRLLKCFWKKLFK
ncbi:MAG: hypothetical protein WC437_04745 [Patescibacteria group bacterium]